MCSIYIKVHTVVLCVWFLSIQSFSLSWNNDYFQKEIRIPLGKGGNASAFISQYGPVDAPKLFVFKRINKNLRWIDHSNRNARIAWSDITNEICANLELYNLPLFVATFAVILDPLDLAQLPREEAHILFAMEPMLGNSAQLLLQFMNDALIINIPWTKLVLARTALGIDMMHKKGWGWNDASAKNILIDHATGYSKLGDFGSSRRLSVFDEDDRHGFIDTIGEFIPKKKELSVAEAKFVSELRDAVANLSGRKTLKRVPFQLEEVKNLALFKNFDWSAASNGSMPSGFIPMNESAYLEFLYGTNPELLERIKAGSSNPIELLKSHDFDSMILGQNSCQRLIKLNPSAVKK